MTLTVAVICFIIAAVLFAVSAWWKPYHGQFLGAGLFFLTVALAFSLNQVHITS